MNMLGIPENIFWYLIKPYLQQIFILRFYHTSSSKLFKHSFLINDGLGRDQIPTTIKMFFFWIERKRGGRAAGGTNFW